LWGDSDDHDIASRSGLVNASQGEPDGDAIPWWGRLANAWRGDPNHDDFASGADLTIRMPIHNGYELSILP